MDGDEKRAFNWALNQTYTSVAASYARTLALYIEKHTPCPTCAELRKRVEELEEWIEDILEIWDPDSIEALSDKMESFFDKLNEIRAALDADKAGVPGGKEKEDKPCDLER